MESVGSIGIHDLWGVGWCDGDAGTSRTVRRAGGGGCEAESFNRSLHDEGGKLIADGTFEPRKRNAFTPDA